MTLWNELVSVALLGTERREPAVPPDAELAVLAGSGMAEDRLLNAAGAIAVYRRAGRVAVAAPEVPGVAPEEALPVCRPAAASRLALLLDEHRPLVAEWLRACGERGLRAPPERLPDLLEIGTTTAALRRDVEAVLGERGQWLAAQETRWAWAAPLPARDEDRERLWETGERGQRLRLFELLRREQPARARELLEEVWKEEEPEDRAWFLDALADGLALDDEAMLERGLGDTRREVRSVAARLLSRLPESAFGLRMRARALPLVRLEGGIRKRLRVALPEEFDEGMAHDGIARKPPRGIGERAWWLLQVVAATPLSAWAEIGLSPDQAASLRANDEFEQPLRKGLARAAEAQADPAWAAPFLEVEPRLADFVHPDVAARVALERLAQGEKDIAERLRAPWPRTPSEQALKLLVKLVRRGGDWQRPRLLAERLDPSLADELAEQLGDLEPGSASASHAQEILTTLSFRRDMHEELR